MLDDHHRMSPGQQGVESPQQLADIVEMQPGGRLVENEQDRASGIFLDQERRQFDALALPAGQRRRRLPEFDIAQSHILQRLQFLDNLFIDRILVLIGCEQVYGSIDRQFENIVNRMTVILHLQHLVLEPFAAAAFAHQFDVGHKLHTDLDDAFALTLLAPASRHVERKVRRSQSIMLRIRLIGKQFTNIIVSF